MEFSNAYAMIDMDAIAANFRAVQEKAGVPVMAVVKADAYGHGAVPVAKLLQNDCAFFGVATAPEALALRRAGIEKPILVLGHVPEKAFPALIKEDVRLAVSSYEEACSLSEEACRQGVTARIHLVVDTGMSRIGFQVSRESAEQCAKIAKLPNLQAEGLFSHFATADCTDLIRTMAQTEKFEAFDEMLKSCGVTVKIRHLDNSAGVINRNRHYEMVRAGIVLYGLQPSEDVPAHVLPLTPAMSWYSRVTQVKLLEPGREISYGGTYVTEKPTMVATVSAGYADGYRRSLSGRFYVLIRGQRAPILGRICMDQFMVDVSRIPDVRVGDTVTLMGTDGEETISVEALAAAAGDTFHYEIICGVSRRDPRVYCRGGQIIGTEYL